MSDSEGLVVAIVGATGAVGEEMIAVLEERGFPVRELRPLASARSAGQRLRLGGHEAVVRELTHDSFEGVDLALFSAGGSVSREFAESAASAGAWVVDNSSAFRMEDDVPLVVPEVNPEAAAGLRRVVLSTYQSASGAGRKAMDELRDQTTALLNFREPPVEQHPRRLAFDVLPQIDVFRDDGYTKEEEKMRAETRKIMGLPGLRITATCVRVPVFVGHGVAANVELERPLGLAEAQSALEAAPGVDGVALGDEYPTPAEVAGIDEVRIGRLRADPSLDSGFDLWIVADNLRKGAATNAVQIAELLRARGVLGGTA
ncbi:MAG: aspartate-semialdehyde dehydrogenase [Planctomycetota bacterium]|jgi:aspartate-semialdehyde dehydrogenase